MNDDATLRPERPMSLDETVSIVRLAEARGLVLKKKGTKLTSKCPFHEGDAPVLVLDPATNTWTCPSCSPEPGTPITWVMRAEGVSRRHAVELLRAGVVGGPRPKDVHQKGVVPKACTVRSMSSPVSVEGTDAEILGKLVTYYEATAKKTPHVLAYLEGRGLRHAQMVEHFDVGFSDRTLGLRLPLANRKSGADLRQRLQRLGVLRETGHEHLRGCITIPTFDDEGRVVQVYGRRIERVRGQGPEHMWLAGERRGLVNRAAFESSEVIVTASIFDALTFWCHGLTNVTSLHGVDGPVEDLVEAIKKQHIRRVIFALRRTPPAEELVERLGHELGGFGVEVFRVVLPSGQDVNELATSVPDATHALTMIVRQAEWVAGRRSSEASPEQPPLRAAPAPRAPERRAVEEPPGPPSEGTDDVVLPFDDRRWRVRGVGGNDNPGSMRVNVFLSRENVGFHVDTFDVYSARHRTAFVRQAGEELGLDEQVVKQDLGRVLLRLEELQHERLRALHAPKPTQIEMTAADRDAALHLLQEPHLLDRVLADFVKIGVVGEHTNLLLGYLVTVSRKLSRPLAVLIQSSSAAGKSSLMEAILSLVPEEDRMTFSAMTGQSLYYMGTTTLRNKVLAISEEVGARRAAYSLKLLQSEGSISIASTSKDPGGRLVAHQYKVVGPVAILMTTTSIDVDDELLSRCIVLTVDESPEQTQRVHAAQRQAATLKGLLARGDAARVRHLHQNAQRVLRPVTVVNPHAVEMVFPDLRVRARRDQAKLLALVEALALLHQHQRPLRDLEHDGRKVDYIEATKQDVELATKLLQEVGAIEQHELPPRTRALLMVLDGYVRLRAEELGVEVVELQFTRREVREHVGLGDTQVKTHLRRLVDAEFVLVHRVPHRMGVVYSLAVNGYAYDPSRSGSGRGSVGGRSAGGRGEVGHVRGDETASSVGGFVNQAGAGASKATSTGSNATATCAVRVEGRAS